MEKFGAIRTPVCGRAASAVAHRVEPVLGPAGRADDDMHAGVDGAQHVVEGRGRHGEVDGHLGAGQLTELVADVVAPGQHQVRCGLDGLADLPAHPPGGPDDGYRDLLGVGSVTPRA